MPVPKRKRSKARRDKRFANKFLTMRVGAVCQTCQGPIASHAPCAGCGYYKGVKVIRTKNDRASERIARQQATRMAQGMSDSSSRAAE